MDECGGLCWDFGSGFQSSVWQDFTWMDIPYPLRKRQRVADGDGRQPDEASEIVQAKEDKDEQKGILEQVT